MSRPLVSVVMPSRNRAQTVPAALDSVLRQSWRELEVLVVDDASDDDRVHAVVEAAAARDPRIRYLRRADCGGPSAARNMGIAAARGDFVAFQDDDDEWLPGKLDAQMSVFERLGPDCVLVGGPLERRPDGLPPRRFDWPVRGNGPWVDVDALIRGFRCFVQTALVRRSVFERGIVFDEAIRTAEDWEWVMRVCAQGGVATVTDLCVVSPEQSGGLASRFDLRPSSYARILEQQKSLLLDHPKTEGLIRYERAKALAVTGRRSEACAEALHAWRLDPQSLKYLATAPLMLGGTAVVADIIRVSQALKAVWARHCFRQRAGS